MRPILLQAIEDLEERGDARTLAAIARALSDPEPTCETGWDIEMLALRDPEQFNTDLRGYWALLGGWPVDVIAALESAERGETPPANALSRMSRDAYISALSEVRVECAARYARREQTIRRAAALLVLSRERRERLAA